MAAATLAAHLPDALQDLPWLVNIPVALALIAGVLLWLAGRRLLRPFMILTGLGVGGLLGFLFLPVVMPGLAISPYLGMVAGAASGLTTALLLYQVATALTFGSALGAGCGVAAAAVLGTALTLPASAQLDPADDNPGQLGGGEQPVYVPPVWKPEIQPLPEPDGGPEGADVENPGVIRAKPAGTKPKPAAPQKATKPIGTTPAKAQKSNGRQAAEPKSAHGGDSRNQTGTAQSDVVRQTAEGGAAKVTAFWGAARAAWGEWWESVPVKNRPWIIGSTIGGLAVGTVLGLLLPAWSAGAVTALAGSAIWLPAALWLGTAWGVPGFVGKGGAGIGGLSTGGWIAVWLVVASIGVACQWYGLMPAGKGKKGKAKKKAKKAADDDE